MVSGEDVINHLAPSLPFANCRQVEIDVRSTTSQTVREPYLELLQALPLRDTIGMQGLRRQRRRCVTMMNDQQTSIAPNLVIICSGDLQSDWRERDDNSVEFLSPQVREGNAELDDSAAVGSRPVKPLREVERAALLNALSHFEGHRRKAAEALGISRSTLYLKLKSLGYH